eukprot:jgi/Chlat1/2384/Chrsp17S02818
MHRDRRDVVLNSDDEDDGNDENAIPIRRLGIPKAARTRRSSVAVQEPKSAPRQPPWQKVHDENPGADRTSAEPDDDDDEKAANSASDEEDEDGIAGVQTEAEASLQDPKAANMAALLRGDVIVERHALLPRLLTAPKTDVVLRAFKSPCPGASVGPSTELVRRLKARKLWVPVNLGERRPLFAPVLAATEDEDDSKLPPGIAPLVLWEPEDGVCNEKGEPVQPISVDPMLVKFLREHQRNGVQFMFECVAGLREFSKRDGDAAGCCGCILADDMGLGKTLQAITLLWTLLRQGFTGTPVAKRAIIVTPTSLVSNWENELSKWLHGRCTCVALCESTRADVLSGIASFLAPRPAAQVNLHYRGSCGLTSCIQVLIISYETFRIHAARFKGDACDLLICDEAHRLKNDKTLTNQALASLQCRRRVLLSGTPMQNDLDEFFAMVNFTNPGILGDPGQFRRRFEAPILNGREPDASEAERHLGAERSAELSEQVNQFILRRTNALLSAHLPPKVRAINHRKPLFIELAIFTADSSGCTTVWQLVAVVCCKMGNLQSKMYQHVINSKSVRKLLLEGDKRRDASQALSTITLLKKLCNHPKLVVEDMRKTGNMDASLLQSCAQLLPAESERRSNVDGLPAEVHCSHGPSHLYDVDRSLGAARWTSDALDNWPELSGKMAVLARMLHMLRTETKDRIVLVSNYTQTLDLVENLCRERHYPYLKLTGSTAIGKRQKLVQAFNDFNQDQFAFLLSSKAGGCGLNLVGGNRLVLFDPDWNPATDKQAAARIWRDGQKKRVFVYRFLAAGSIDEKIFQRQLSKEGLQAVVNNASAGAAADAKAQVNTLSTEELRKLFDFRDTISVCNAQPSFKQQVARSDTHDTLNCRRCKPSNATDEEGAAEVIDIGGFAETAIPCRQRQPCELQVGTPAEEDLKDWAHHAEAATVPDSITQRIGDEHIGFVFTCQINGQLPKEPLTPEEKCKTASAAAVLGCKRPYRSPLRTIDAGNSSEPAAKTPAMQPVSRSLAFKPIGPTQSPVTPAAGPFSRGTSAKLVATPAHTLAATPATAPGSTISSVKAAARGKALTAGTSSAPRTVPQMRTAARKSLRACKSASRVGREAGSNVIHIDSSEDGSSAGDSSDASTEAYGEGSEDDSDASM